jgi:hypothetical protein
MEAQLLEIGKTIARVFVGTMLAAVVAAMLDGLNVFTLDWEMWQPFVVAGAIAAGTVLVNALNPADARYGIGAK